MPARKTPVNIYQLKVTLRDSHPPIWRRLRVPGNSTLYTLHQILQVAMGWTDSHLHEFTVGETSYRPPSPYDGSLGDEFDPAAFSVDEVNDELKAFS